MSRWRQRIELLPFHARRAEFYCDFAEMYRRNEAMIAFLEGEISNSVRTGDRSRGRALRMILARYQDGNCAGRISHLLQGVVPKGDAMMLVGVDRADDKSEALLALAEAVEKQQVMKRVVLSYSVLPAVVLPLCYALIMLLSHMVVDIEQAVPVYAREEMWRGMNGWAKAVAGVAKAHGSFVMGVFVGSIAATVWSLPRWRGRGRLMAESLPLYSLYRDFQSGLLFTSMAMLLKTGGTLKGAIEDIAQRSSLWMRWHLNRVLRSLDDNPTGTLEAFSRGVLSPQMLARAATLLRTADSFADVLIELGTREENRVLARVKKAAVLTNVALVGTLIALASFMGIAAITVPGKFASVTEYSRAQTLKQLYDAKQSQKEAAMKTGRTEPAK